MNVGELKEALDDFGDHLPVELVIERGENDERHDTFDVDHRNINGEPVVALTVSE